jgi:serine/threonine-protein kinase RsbW
MTPRREIHLTLDSRLENVALVGRALHGIGAEAGLEPLQCDQLELCVVEAVTNSILHAYDGKPGKEVRLDVALLDDRLEVRVVDQGTPMPPGTLESAVPQEPGDVLALAEGGRGLVIMRQLLDGLDYASDGRGNVLTLVKRLGGAVKAPS